MFILLSVWSWLTPLLVGVWCLLVCGIIGFFFSRSYFTKYLEKNPPVNEKMIRAMMQQMGRTPSEKQFRQIMASMNQAKGK